MKKWHKILLIIIPITILSSQCDPNNGLLIPSVLVEEDIHLSIEGPHHPGTSITVDGGVNGIIIYCEDLDTYHAYDRTCTMWPDHNIAVEEDSTWSGQIFTCPECGSQYWLSLGAEPMNGPAVYGLKEYYTKIDGTILLVYN